MSYIVIVAEEHEQNVLDTIKRRTDRESFGYEVAGTFRNRKISDLV